jgi:transcriptional regulator with XRE-family HTH domain
VPFLRATSFLSGYDRLIMPLPHREEVPLQRLGATIRYYRRQRRLTQKVVAARAGLDHTSLSQIERGRQNVTILNLLSIAKALEIPLINLIQPLEAFLHPPPFPPEDHP